ncbi:MAG: DMT family transporter [Alphaproteobacteria bacterium]
MSEVALPPLQGRHNAGLVPYILLLLMGLAWGLMISVQKIAAAAGAHPIGLGFWMVATSTALLAIPVLFRTPPRRFRRDVMIFCVLCGVIGIGFPSVALAWAASELPAGIVAITFTSMPIFTYALSVLFRVEAAERQRLIGVCIGMAGMLLILLPKQSLPTPDMAPWALLAILACFSMATENFLAGGFRPPDVTSMQLTCGRNSVAVILLAPIVYFTDTAIPLFEPWGPMQYAATATGFLTAGAFTTLLYVIKTSGPIFGSQSSYLITLFGMGWGMILFDERHSGYVWAALLLTILGLALVQPRKPINILEKIQSKL